MPAKKTQARSRTLVCPKRVKVATRTMKVVSNGGDCYVKRKDGSKAAVRKVARGHKGFGTFARRKKRKSDAVVAVESSGQWAADPGRYANVKW
jgi:hypothetical protein